METKRFIVGQESDLPSGHSRSVRVAGKRIALFNEGGNLFAMDEACPHMRADLSQGTLKDGILTCSWHGWRFDVRTGRGLTKQWACLKSHRLVLDDGQLVVEILELPPPPFECSDESPREGEGG